MVIIMLGAPASGKGSVAEILSAEFNIPAISSGDIFRKYLSNGSKIGKKANEYMTKGELVPDDITVELIASRLKENDVENGLILDGFPRTVNQAKVLDEMLAKEGKKIDIVVNLETPEDEILERITNRRICSNSDCKAVYNTVLHPSKVEGICDKCGSPTYQRDDDKLEKAKNRLEVYHRETAPVADYYKETGALYSTVLSKSVNRMKDEVAKDVINYLKNK
jgi:adenylate kinase